MSQLQHEYHKSEQAVATLFNDTSRLMMSVHGWLVVKQGLPTT